MEHATEDIFLLLTVAKYTICSFVSLLLLVYIRIPVIANTSEADYLVHCFGKSDTCFGYGNLLLSEI